MKVMKGSKKNVRFPDVEIPPLTEEQLKKLEKNLINYAMTRLGWPEDIAKKAAAIAIECEKASPEELEEELD